MSNLVKYAKNELELCGAFEQIVGGVNIGKSVMELVELFAKQGHSGLSASITRGLFKNPKGKEIASQKLEKEINEEEYDSFDEYAKMVHEAVLQLFDCIEKQKHSSESEKVVRQMFDLVANYKPLTPLTGNDDEWNEVDENYYQNKRCSAVFKEDGRAYYIDGRIFIEPNGAAYTSRDSDVDVVFPYTPVTEFIHVDEEGKPVMEKVDVPKTVNQNY